MLVTSPKVMAPRARIVPTKLEDAPIVVPSVEVQKTFSDLALFLKMIEIRGPVVMVPEAWNSQIADESPLASRVSVVTLFIEREPVAEQ